MCTYVCVCVCMWAFKCDIAHRYGPWRIHTSHASSPRRSHPCLLSHFCCVLVWHGHFIGKKKFCVIVDDLFVCIVLVFTHALHCCAQPWRHTSRDLTGLTCLCVSGLVSMGHGPFTRDMTWLVWLIHMWYALFLWGMTDSYSHDSLIWVMTLSPCCTTTNASKETCNAWKVTCKRDLHAWRKQTKQRGSLSPYPLTLLYPTHMHMCSSCGIGVGFSSYCVWSTHTLAQNVKHCITHRNAHCNTHYNTHCNTNTRAVRAA